MVAHVSGEKWLLPGLLKNLTHPRGVFNGPASQEIAVRYSQAVREAIVVRIVVYLWLRSRYSLLAVGKCKFDVPPIGVGVETDAGHEITLLVHESKADSRIREVPKHREIVNQRE
jgi:hypothetical protein